MKRSVALVAMLAAGCGKDAATEQPKDVTRHAAVTTTDDRAAWREDLRVLAEQLPAKHVEPWFHVAEAEWRAAVTALDGKLATLDDAQIEAELMRLVAMIGDGHTGLRSATPRTTLYPLALYWFEDGIFVLDAPDDAAWARGRQLVGVGGRGIDEVIAALSPLIARDNDAQLRNQLGIVGIDPVLLHGAGLADSIDRASFTLRAPDGSEQVYEATPGPPRGMRVPAGKLPLSLQRKHTHYWNDYLPDQRLMYLQYNQCADASDFPFAKLVAGTLGFADQKPIDKFVIDLRFNGGGDSRVIKPLIDGLAARPELARKVYVAIGRRTFSSAILNAIELKQRLGAVLVGEPTGGSPSHHGEVKIFELPRSKLVVQYSTKYFANPDFPGDAVTPDVPVGVTSADFAALRDPVLDAIAAHTR